MSTERLSKLFDRFMMVLMWLIMVAVAVFLAFVLASRFIPCRSLMDAIITAGLGYVIYDISKTTIRCPPWKSALWN